jgi:tight adherence protein C
MILYLVLIMATVGLCTAAVMTFVGSRRSRTAERLSTIIRYGFESDAAAVAALPEDTGPHGVEQLMTWLGEIVSRRFGAVGEDEIRSQLMAAGMYTTSPRTLLGYRVIAPVVLPIIAFLAIGASSPTHIALIAIMVPAGWSLPLVFVQRKARARLEQIDRRLPDLIDLLCVMVEAGLGFSGALRMAASQQEGPLSEELRLSLQEQTMGLGIDEALTHMAERCETPAMRAFVRAMSQGERMGISTGQIMRTLSHEMRARRRSKAEEQAQKAPVKMLIPLVFLIFPSLFIILMTPAAITIVNNLKL